MMPAMGKRFDLLVFDWDGTLMDSAGSIVASVQAACRDLGLRVPSQAQASYIIGLGLSDALQTLLPDLPPGDYARLVERYRYHYLARDEMIPLFEGAAQVIETLHQAGFMLAVATGKSRRGLDRALGNSGLAPFFHGTRCADETFSKPHPGMLLELMEELGTSRQRTLMIGDTTHDLQMASNAGVQALGVAYGAHPRHALLQLAPLACVDSVAQLRQWLSANA